MKFRYDNCIKKLKVYHFAVINKISFGMVCFQKNNPWNKYFSWNILNGHHFEKVYYVFFSITQFRGIAPEKHVCKGLVPVVVTSTLTNKHYFLPLSKIISLNHSSKNLTYNLPVVVKCKRTKSVHVWWTARPQAEPGWEWNSSHTWV